MGFNKRMISKDVVLSTEGSDLDRLFDADSLIFDTWSHKFYDLYKSGLPKEVVIQFLTNTGV